MRSLANSALRGRSLGKKEHPLVGFTESRQSAGQGHDLFGRLRQLPCQRPQALFAGIVPLAALATVIVGQRHANDACQTHYVPVTPPNKSSISAAVGADRAAALVPPFFPVLKDRPQSLPSSR
jgi:hypothetical protein